MMIRQLLMIAALGIALPNAQAGFKVPKSAFTPDRLNAAQSEAKAENKAITIVYSDAKTTCPLCVGATTDAFQGLKQRSVIVYADTKTGDFQKLPRLVQEALKSAEAGKFIPKTVIVDAELSKVIAIVPYTRDDGARNKMMREAKKKIEAALPATSSANRSLPPMPLPPR